MATRDSPMEDLEIHRETEGSYSSSVSDDTESGLDYDITDQTYSKFEKKAKARVVEGESPEELEATDEKDEKNFEQVQKIIDAGEIEKLKVVECKLYLRKKGLRLTGNKDTLIQRIKEHLKIINGEGERKYPPSSFELDCRGDACAGDVVLFEQNVFDMFNLVSRRSMGPPCGKRIVAGRIVKESYGASKQQHTFTIEVLWSKGEKPLPPLYPLLIKGRNLYRMKTLRQRWDDEGKRPKFFMEKHSRLDVARANREARIQNQEKKKAIWENRVSIKEASSNQTDSHPIMTQSQQYHHQEPAMYIDPANPELFVHHGENVAMRRKTGEGKKFGV